MAERAAGGYVKAGEAPADAAAQGRGATPPANARSAVPARFSLLYESRDKRLCLFEDADGHLTSVDSDRFA